MGGVIFVPMMKFSTLTVWLQVPEFWEPPEAGGNVLFDLSLRPECSLTGDWKGFQFVAHEFRKWPLWSGGFGINIDSIVDERGEVFEWSLSRVGNDPQDTLVGDLEIEGLRLEFGESV
jgi:hypothetical protein